MENKKKRRAVAKREEIFDADKWKPKTELGKKVKKGEIKSLGEILDTGGAILESEIVDVLIPNLEVDLLSIGQSKGKFGGGKKSIWRQTQKKTREGNKPRFASIAIVGNKDGYIGIGFGKAKETVPAREKAIRRAKLNIFKIKRGCGSWECGCGEPHTIPFEVEGKRGSVRFKLSPAPKGADIKAEEECRKILSLAGVKDVYSKARGHTATKINLVYACIDALEKLSKVKVPLGYIKKAGIVDGVKE